MQAGVRKPLGLSLRMVLIIAINTPIAHSPVFQAFELAKMALDLKSCNNRFCTEPHST